MSASPFAEFYLLPEDTPAAPPAAGQFRVFDVAELMATYPSRAPLSFGRRPFYKISLVRGRSRVEYGDQALDFDGPGLWFASSQAPYRWHPHDAAQVGYLCAFTEEFFLPGPGRMALAALPLFRPGACPVRALNEEQYGTLATIFEKMQQEYASDYAFGAELLRAYLLELIYYGQKLWPAATAPAAPSAAARLAIQFAELLEQQFPLLVPGRPPLHSARDYADALAVHVNYLNRVLKEQTGHTTTTLLARRLAQEAKLLLRQSDWTIAEIADSLNFTDTSHFCRFFRRATHIAPGDFRAARLV